MVPARGVARRAARLTSWDCGSYSRVDPLRLVVALAGIVAGLVGLTLDWVSIFPSVMVVSETNPVARSFSGDAFIYFWTYFTHLYPTCWPAAVLRGWC